MKNRILKDFSAMVCGAFAMLAASCSRSTQTNVGFTNARTFAAITAIVGLISVIAGGLALRSAGRVKSHGSGTIAALVLGLFTILLSVVHLGTSAGGFGTGGGRAGAIVALVLGIIGASLGGLAFARSSRSRGNV